MPLPIIDPARYEDQLATKLARYRADFAEFDLPEPQVFRSAPLHYRLRAEFRLWHHDGRIDYAMFDSADPKQPILVDSFPPAAEPIATLMPRLRDALQASEALRSKIFQVDFLATLSGECLVSLIYHRPLDEAWEAAARTLAADLNIQLIGRSRKQKIVLGRDWVQEVLAVDGQRLRFQQFEGSFTQPNGEVNQHMLGWARAQAKRVGARPQGPGDLLELYCGNGNFTVALAPLFGRVLATEMSKTSVNAAHTNLADNNVANVTLVRMASQEISDALAGGREYRRMQGVNLASYRFSTLFVDPPRAGLDEGTIALAKGFDNILYISCNPETLRANVAALSATHRIDAAAAFDQFPYTHHLECGLLLQKR
ncbi:tRNA (uridine(54)-C5)-methyltransferase TrmA [Thauera sp.]|jgi:tRNA (uracil-5-)-methyltransferase|uniref:tRNA (uridine(54)-C5)-methyltransferase TrmA n=1 Tax=Thauera sp. TaxID=1905334 RepID=UPI002A361FCE|nr:tRNA (uridine(54)-C5)-methyltransferase TrmA [Thauera sp.]MDX9884456.1 tRNA (uridine(54)-C5)-methyltransferase TrmA [Thauera sp.]